MHTKHAYAAASRVLIAGLVVLLTASCDSLLEENPQDRITRSNFYETEADAVAAVDAAYSQLQNFGNYRRAVWAIADGATDDFGLKPSEPSEAFRTLVLDYSFDATNEFIESAWQDAYTGINHTNAVLDNVPAIDMDETLRRRLLGEARYLRALYYFNLVRFFGRVPLLQNETASLDSLNVARASVDDVYALITGDLEQAISVLPTTYSSDGQGRATRGAAQTLLAKVHLTREDYSEAAQLAGAVIDSDAYALLPDWKAVFRIENEFNEESVFEVSFDPDLGEGSHHTLASLPQGYPGGPAWGLFYLLDNFVSTFAPNDERGLEGTYMTNPHTDLTGTTYEWTYPPGPAVNKWFDETSPNNLMNRGYNDMANNWYVFRYAEVLLMYAEAVNQGGTPSNLSKYDALNRVRMRAELAPVEDLSPATFTDTLRLERRRELAFEGKRWFDLKRWGTLLERVTEAKDASVPEDRVLLPVPQRELDTNTALEQNLGY